MNQHHPTTPTNTATTIDTHNALDTPTVPETRAARPDDTAAGHPDDTPAHAVAALAAIGLDERVRHRIAAWQAAEGAPAAPPGAVWRRVTEIQRETLTLHDGRSETPARPLPALRHALAATDDALAVGDWVLAAPDAHGGWWVHQRLPPAGQLARRVGGEGGGTQRAVIVANVDTALLVMGLDHDFNLRRLERYLVLARGAGVTPVVVLTKADLADGSGAAMAEPGTAGADGGAQAPGAPGGVDAVAARLRAVQALLPPHGAVVAVNTLAEDGAAARRALAPWLQRGQTLALLGSSGAGKSTLTNALTRRDAGDGGHDGAPAGAAQATGGTRAGDGRGRHTTTARSLHLTPQGACLVDTPGLRALRPDTDEGSVEAAFDDVARWAAQCRFRDCRHEGEPGCAVAGAVAPERLRSFHKLQREARRDTLTPLQKQAQVAQWKARSRAVRRHLAGKRGQGDR